MLKGSCAWFAEQVNKKNKFVDKMEEMRESFISRFSPDKLNEMDSDSLLANIFDKTPDSMMHLLMMDSCYREFGASSEYAYMSILYKGADGVWTYYDKNKHIKLTLVEAKEKAEFIRDIIVASCKVISESELNTIEDYKELNKKLEGISYQYNYVTILKYFQMIYPFFFPCMYSDNTLTRCIQILGLRSNGKSSNKRIENMGTISLFIRNCDINNVAFNSVYADEWGWTEKQVTCEAANQNYELSVHYGDINKSYYKLGNYIDLGDIVVKIESEIANISAEGKERDALVKVRVNQSEYRDLLSRRYKKCCLCNVSDKDLLIASHIKPWSKCEPSERVDINNGFMLCPNHDKLFDRGYISFKHDGTIMISDRLTEQNRLFMNVNESMTLSINANNEKYLEYHRNNIFQ
ncbi:MAG: HNH endonuclease [Lachnospiraceae bacterium]|nr:HNH endonuclease [Lachnospiraceae bacterium]